MKKDKFEIGQKVRVVRCVLDEPKHKGAVGLVTDFWSGGYHVGLSKDGCAATKLEKWVETRGRPKGSKNKKKVAYKLDWTGDPTCPKTRTGRHILIPDNITKYDRCRACGLIDDLWRED